MSLTISPTHNIHGPNIPKTRHPPVHGERARMTVPNGNFNGNKVRVQTDELRIPIIGGVPLTRTPGITLVNVTNLISNVNHKMHHKTYLFPNTTPLRTIEHRYDCCYCPKKVADKFGYFQCSIPAEPQMQCTAT